MYRIRFHGRGGQGIRTAGRILGSAFFAAGFEVQDAPRYGAERRGAPIFAYVRADRKRINERGVIHAPDIVVVADDSLLAVAGDSITEGTGINSILLVITARKKDELAELLRIKCRIITIDETLLKNENTAGGEHSLSIISSAAAALLTGEITSDGFEEGIRAELPALTENELLNSCETARMTFRALEEYHAAGYKASSDEPEPAKASRWVDLKVQDSRNSSAAIFKIKTSAYSPTGTWRTSRPVLESVKCRRCLLCYVSCPDSSISLTDEHYPEIDYEHCKGCLLCAAICPAKAISVEPEKKRPQEDKCEQKASYR